MCYIKNNIGTNIEEICNNFILKLERYFNMEICSQLITNKFEINFVNSGINEVLDEVSQEYDEVENQKFHIKDFKSLIGSKLKGAKRTY